MKTQLAHVPVPEMFLIWSAGTLAIIIGVSVAMKISDWRTHRKWKKFQEEEDKKESDNNLH